MKDTFYFLKEAKRNIWNIYGSLIEHVTVAMFACSHENDMMGCQVDIKLKDGREFALMTAIEEKYIDAYLNPYARLLVEMEEVHRMVSPFLILRELNIGSIAMDREE